METQLITNYTEKAWHLLSLILRHDRPININDLPSKCTLYDSDPGFIRFLCHSIPDSPIRLINGYVTFSETGISAVARFFDEIVTVTGLIPRYVPRLLGGFGFSDLGSRKRKWMSSSSFLLDKRGCFDDRMPLRFGGGGQDICSAVLDRNLCRRIETESNNSSVLEIDYQELERLIFAPSVSTDYTLQLLDHDFIDVEYGYIEIKDEALRLDSHETGCESESRSHDRLLCLEAIPEEKPVKLEASNDGNMNIVNSITSQNHGASSLLGVDQRITFPQPANVATAQACESLADAENGKSDEVMLHDYNKGHLKDPPINTPHTGNVLVDNTEKFPSTANIVECYMSEPTREVNKESQGGLQIDQIKPPSTPKVHKNNSVFHEKKCQTMDDYLCNGPQTELAQFQRHEETNTVRHKTKQNSDQEMNGMDKREASIENRKGAPSNPINNGNKQNPFPEFESFVVEEEEGSGGYGTVFRARRKSDGVIFAIKCPHVEANRNHVQNELKTLQRVGGKNYVIKYEGSFKSGDSDCLVLEHVKHDRPEVLKRDINIFQLQWYGYCMFRALAGLHKQGIVHRDVKPGNFLFSRNGNKGFLIDFNLALDLHRRQTAAIPKSGHDLNIGRSSIPQTKSVPPAKDRKSVKSCFPESIKNNAGKGSKSLVPPGILIKKANQAKAFNYSNYRNINISQGADGSGVTSAKDTRTPSAQRLKQLLPSTVRKEYISWAHDALQDGGNHVPIRASTSTRKRVAAPRQTQSTDKKFFYPTPMPLHSSGIAISGAGLLQSNRQNRREGPCAGTKGFRAPEVLFKSVHQGPKVDTWSAGVTLLYLMIGRTPFTGEPDQNIKEIANLRGSEDLWEVAKLHNQESLFPQELFDTKHLSPVKLKDWCARNTRRPDFQEVIPRSLFDLVDKCLTVNPRLRITAEEALRHEFFTPCHDVLRKQRQRKQALDVESETTLVRCGDSELCEVE